MSQKLYQVFKCPNTFILYISEASLSTSWLSSGTQKFRHLLGYHAIGINSSFSSFLSALRFSNFIFQAESLTRIIVSGQLRSQRNYKKIALTTHDFTENFYLI